jgi:hypothetical protein
MLTKDRSSDVYLELRRRDMEMSAARELRDRDMSARTVLRGFASHGSDRDILREILTLHGVEIRE